MSRELDKIIEAISTRKKEVDTAKKMEDLAKEKMELEKQLKAKQKEQESTQRSIENKNRLESLGIVRLFEEIRDSGIVKSKDRPFYKRVPKYKTYLFRGKVQDGYNEVKIGEYEPARIVWGEECGSVTLAFNIREKTYGDLYDPSYYYADHISFSIIKNGEIEFSSKHIGSYTSQNDKKSPNDFTTIIKNPVEIPELIATYISKTIN